MVSLLLGTAFGRFDLRLATGEREPLPEPEPCDPLPGCSPGMLTGLDGLPAVAPPPGYPLAFPADGILVDDAGIDGNEVLALREELLRVARLPYQPDQNDGVLITAAPLWQLFRHKPWQKELKRCWESLAAGDYDWAHLALALWPERVRERCRADRLIAIAHGLEDLYDA